MRPIALSRLVSSNRSATNERSWPRSPRNFSSVRGSRPSPSAKFVRSVCSSAAAARSFVAWLCWRSAANSRRTTSTFTVTPASWSATSPILSARSTRVARSSIGRSATNAARAGSRRVRRSTTIRSPSVRTIVAGSTAGVGSETMLRASMTPSSTARVTPSLSRAPRARKRPQTGSPRTAASSRHAGHAASAHDAASGEAADRHAASRTRAPTTDEPPPEPADDRERQHGHDRTRGARHERDSRLPHREPEHEVPTDEHRIADRKPARGTDRTGSPRSRRPRWPRPARPASSGRPRRPWLRAGRARPRSRRCAPEGPRAAAARSSRRRRPGPRTSPNWTIPPAIPASTMTTSPTTGSIEPLAAATPAVSTTRSPGTGIGIPVSLTNSSPAMPPSASQSMSGIRAQRRHGRPAHSPVSSAGPSLR